MSDRQIMGVAVFLQQQFIIRWELL